MTQILDAPWTDARAEGLSRTLVDLPGPDRRQRRRFAILGGVTVFWAVIFARHGGYSWHYFVQGSTLLFHGASGSAAAGGLDLYANYPQLQIGPFTFAVAEVLRHLGGTNGLFAACVFMAALGLVVLYVLERIVEAVRPELAGDDRLHLTMLIGGSAFMIGWTDLSVAISHLDDALALTLAVLALWAASADLPAIAGICIGLSVDSKPWALVFLPLILTVPAHTRRHAAVWTVVTILVAYLPFVIADPHTLSAASAFTITNEPSSALRALGVSDSGTPSWDRAAQIVLGCGLGAVAVRRRRWPALMLLGVGARIALDPGVYGYYTAGVLLGALIWDLLGHRRPMPLWTLISGAALAVSPMLISDESLLGELRLALVAVFTVALLLGPAQAPAGFTARERTLPPGPAAVRVSPDPRAGRSVRSPAAPQAAARWGGRYRRS
ncbi:hypothetical protein KDK95_23590 [Actinospica sp. MGRD01-02]|uniref:Uncharacterized protein n=1 Tax=Actinospica acidithermotolerans TaxID=2828514 RepID=A0A941EDA2_9ACTN|nr:hypothetical protein [Actinospica acidithermotolerans]MBR7829311.1 hypothetical protein [Actinospica acidithermotolerans]